MKKKQPCKRTLKWEPIPPNTIWGSQIIKVVRKLPPFYSQDHRYIHTKWWNETTTTIIIIMIIIAIIIIMIIIADIITTTTMSTKLFTKLDEMLIV